MAEKKYYRSSGSTDRGSRQKMEDNLQAECVRWFNNTYCTTKNDPRCIIFAVPNGGSRDQLEAMKLRDTGVLAGVSDLIIILPNKTLFVEMKIDGGRQSDKQIDFENRVKSLGYEYFIIYNLEDFKKMIYARL